MREQPKEQAGVTELVPQIVLGNGRVVRPLGQLCAGHGLDEQQVGCLRVVPSGDQPWTTRTGRSERSLGQSIRDAATIPSGLAAGSMARVAVVPT